MQYVANLVYSMFPKVFQADSYAFMVWKISVQGHDIHDCKHNLLNNMVDILEVCGVCLTGNLFFE